MPIRSRHASTVVLLAVGLAVLAIVLFGRVPADGRWVADLSNAAHGPAFAAVTLIIWTLLRRAGDWIPSLWYEYSLVVAIAVLLGALVELLQLLIGRDASFGDLWHDGLGALAAAGCLLVFDSRTRASPSWQALRGTGVAMAAAASVLMLAPLAVTAAAYLQRYSGFPTLVDFSSPVSTYFLGVYSSVTAERSALPRELWADTADPKALHARVTDSGGWALALWEPIADWRGYERVNLDLANPTFEPLVLRLRVRDRTQRRNRRSGYQGSIEVAPSSRVVRSVALTTLTSGEGTARVDISQVNSVVIARDGANRAREFYVMRIWLD